MNMKQLLAYTLIVGAVHFAYAQDCKTSLEQSKVKFEAFGATAEYRALGGTVQEAKKALETIDPALQAIEQSRTACAADPTMSEPKLKEINTELDDFEKMVTSEKPFFEAEVKKKQQEA